MNHEPTEFVAIFIGRMMQTATDEEVEKGMKIQGFSHEGVIQPNKFITDLDKTHRNVWIERGRKARVFSTLEEAEDFIAKQTVRKSGWAVIPRIGR